MLQFPCPLPPSSDIPQPSTAERFFACLLLVGIAASLISFLLPRPLFRKLVKIAFPFLPERIGEDDE
jgi:hypothetical protein